MVIGGLLMLLAIRRSPRNYRWEAITRRWTAAMDRPLLMENLLATARSSVAFPDRHQNNLSCRISVINPYEPSAESGVPFPTNLIRQRSIALTFISCGIVSWASLFYAIKISTPSRSWLPTACALRRTLVVWFIWLAYRYPGFVWNLYRD